MSEQTPRIRRAVPADAVALAEVAARIFEETFGQDNRPEDIAAYLAASYGARQQSAELADPDMVTLVVEEDGRFVAYAQVRRRSTASVTSEPRTSGWARTGRRTG